MDKRTHKVKSDFGMGDYHRFYNKKYGKIERKRYSNIITDFNLLLRDLLIINNVTYSIPSLHFHLVLKKERRRPKIVDGKLINNIPVNWPATNSLWKRDEEAKKKKLLVRYNNSHTSGYIFRILFKKTNAKIKYRSVYKFQPNRQFKRDLAKKLNNPDLDIDAYLLYKKKKHVQ